MNNLRISHHFSKIRDPTEARCSRMPSPSGASATAGSSCLTDFSGPSQADTFALGCEFDFCERAFLRCWKVVAECKGRDLAETSGRTDDTTHMDSYGTFVLYKNFYDMTRYVWICVDSIPIFWISFLGHPFARLSFRHQADPLHWRPFFKGTGAKQIFIC